MERIKVFKGKEWLAKFFVVFGILYTLIALELKNGPKKINLENLEFEDIRKIKGKLEKIQKITS